MRRYILLGVGNARGACDVPAQGLPTRFDDPCSLTGWPVCSAVLATPTGKPCEGSECKRMSCCSCLLIKGSAMSACRSYLGLGNDEGAKAVVPNCSRHCQYAHHTHSIPKQDLAPQCLHSCLPSKSQNSDQADKKRRCRVWHHHAYLFCQQSDLKGKNAG